MNIFKQLSSSILDALFPRRCVGCGCYDTWACASCVQEHRNVECLDLLTADAQSAATSIITIGLYSNPFWRELVQLLKFHNVRSLSEALTQELAATLWHYMQQQTHPQQPTVLVPIPLHKRRLRERGFNQATVVAERLSDHTDWPVLEQLLLRTHYTPSQTTLSHEEREQNIAHAFSYTSAELSLHGVHVILVDDVVTTGSTALEAAQTLQELEPASVHIVAIARG